MQIQNTIKLIAACAILTWATGSFAQYSHATGGAHGSAVAEQLPVSAYASQQTRSIKALSEAQTRDLLAGKGMELAKAAELNGYPGPMHTLELAELLALSAAQKQSTQTLLDCHTDQIAQRQAALRNAHLETHLQQTALLTPQQISRYAELRVYTGTASFAAPASPSSHQH